MHRENFENLKRETTMLAERLAAEQERGLAAWEKDKLPGLIEGIRSELDGTDFIRRHTYLFPYDGIKGDGDILYRVLAYKQDLENYQGLDCDVSLASMLVFCHMYQELSEAGIRLQRGNNGQKKKYEFRYAKDATFSGDTMTSPWTSFKEYLTLLWFYLGDGADEDLIGKCRGPWGDGLCIPEAYKDEYPDFKSYFLKKCSSADRSFLDKVISFMPENDRKILYEFLYRSYQAGNFLLIPGCPASFNAGRSNYGRWDTGERLVIGFYRYFKAKEAGREPEEYRKILGDLFTVNKKNTAITCENWLKVLHIKSWEDFVEKHFLLSSYVDERTMQPRLWRKGGRVSPADIEGGFEQPLPVLPKNLSALSHGELRKHMEEILLFWERTAERNRIRTEKIAEALCDIMESDFLLMRRN